MGNLQIKITIFMLVCHLFVFSSAVCSDRAMINGKSSAFTVWIKNVQVAQAILEICEDFNSNPTAWKADKDENAVQSIVELWHRITYVAHRYSAHYMLYVIDDTKDRADQGEISITMYLRHKAPIRKLQMALDHQDVGGIYIEDSSDD